MYDSFNNRDFVKFARVFSTAFFMLTLLTFLSFALPFLFTGDVSIEKPIVSDGSREAMSFDEMFPKENYWR